MDLADAPTATVDKPVLAVECPSASPDTGARSPKCEPTAIVARKEPQLEPEAVCSHAIETRDLVKLAKPGPKGTKYTVTGVRWWIWTDGGRKDNQGAHGAAGWGCVIFDAIANHGCEFCGGVDNATNNQMELRAVIHALKEIESDSGEVIIFMDSEYVRETIETNLLKWKVNGFKTSGGKPVKNEELMRELDSLLEKRADLPVRTFHVRAHDSEHHSPGNDRADSLTNDAMRMIQDGNEAVRRLELSENIGQSLLQAELAEFQRAAADLEAQAKKDAVAMEKKKARPHREVKKPRRESDEMSEDVVEEEALAGDMIKCICCARAFKKKGIVTHINSAHLGNKVLDEAWIKNNGFVRCSKCQALRLRTSAAHHKCKTDKELETADAPMPEAAPAATTQALPRRNAAGTMLSEQASMFLDSIPLLSIVEHDGLATVRHIPQNCMAAYADALQLIFGEWSQRGKHFVKLYCLFPMLCLQRQAVGASTSNSGAIAARLKRFNLQQLSELYEEACQQMKASVQVRAETMQGKSEGDLRVARVVRAAAEGKLSQACECLMGGKSIMSATPANVITLQSKQVLRQREFPNDCDDLPTEQANLVERNLFETSVLRAPRKRACDVAGWCYEHFKAVVWSGLSDQLHLVCQQWMTQPKAYTAHWSEEERALMAGAHVILIDKGGGDVRPIAVGMTWRRLFARSVCLQFKSAFRVSLSGLQFGVAAEGGLETLVHAFRMLAEWSEKKDLDDLEIWQFDATNAFNSIHRAAILEQLMANYRQLAPFFLAMYHVRGLLRVHLDNGTYSWMLSEEGVQQGDPLALIYFALALQRALVEAQRMNPTVLFGGYVDDVSGAGKHGKDGVEGPAAKAFREFKELAAAIGLKANLKKCIVDGVSRRSEGYPAEMVLRASKVPEGEDSARGLKCLGSPIGSSEYVRSFLRGVCDELKALIAAISNLEDVQVALLLLRHASGQFGFMERTVPSAAVLEFAGEIEGAVLEAVSKLLGLTLLPGTAARVFLPEKSGGLGMHSVSRGARVAYTTAFATFAGRISELPAAMGKFYTECVSEERSRELNLLLKDCGAAALRKPQNRKLNTLLSARAVESAVAVIITGEPELEAELKRMQDPSAFAFLLAVPTEQSTKIAPPQMRISVALWLGLNADPLLPGARYCGCNWSTPKDRTVTHMLRCGHGGGTIKRHNAIEAIVVEMSKAAEVPVHAEVMHILENQQRADAVLEKKAGVVARDTVVDVMVTVGALSAGDRTKCTKYEETCTTRGMEFVPLIFGIAGDCGEKAKTLFEKLLRVIPSDVQHYEQRPGAPNVRHHFMQLLSCAVHRGTAAHLIESTRRSNARASDMPAPRYDLCRCK